jgi:hypothetical protein
MTIGLETHFAKLPQHLLKQIFRDPSQQSQATALAEIADAGVFEPKRLEAAQLLKNNAWPREITRPWQWWLPRP